MKKQFVCLFFVTFMLIIACNSDQIQKIDKILSKDSLPDLSVKNVEVWYSDSARVKMKLFAPEVKDYTQSGKGRTIFAKGLNVVFYNNFFKPESSLRADYGSHDSKTDVWEYRGGVKIVNDIGDTLTTEQLFANRTKDSLYTKKYVRIKSANGSLIENKDGITTDLRFKKRKFKNTTGTIKL